MTHAIVAIVGLTVLFSVAMFSFAAEENKPPSVPVLVELYTSEGCSSCPPADKMLKDLAQQQPVEGALIVPLGLHVDYWNRLGWADPFSSPQFSQRQSAFAKGRSIYTPMMVVDGGQEFVGSDREQALQSIAAAAKADKAGITIESSWEDKTHLQVKLTPGKLPALANRVPVFVALVEDGLSSEVKRGENAGKKLEHAPIARLLEQVGSADTGPLQARLEIPGSWNRSKLMLVSFAQDAQTWHVWAVGVARVAMN